MNKSTIIVYLSDFKLVFYDESVSQNYILQEKIDFNGKAWMQRVNETQKDLYICCKNLERDFHEFCKQYIYIEAAGGLIHNDQNEYLFIFRHAKWDLPKGKLEKNESPEQGAIRECQEECGLHTILIERFLMHTYHIYFFKKGWALKKTYWYHMLCNETNLTPQLEESITEVAWKKKSALPDMLHNTYFNIIDLLKASHLIE